MTSIQHDEKLYKLVEYTIRNKNIDEIKRQKMIDKLKIFIEFDKEYDKFDNDISIEKVLKTIDEYESLDDNIYIATILIKIYVYEMEYERLLFYTIFSTVIFKTIIQYNNCDCLEFILDSGVIPCYEAYEEAIKYGNLRFLKGLSEFGDSLDALHAIKAIEYDHIDIFRYICDHDIESDFRLTYASIDCKCVNYFTILLEHELVEYDEFTLDYLIKNGTIDHLEQIYDYHNDDDEICCKSVKYDNIEFLKFAVEKELPYDKIKLLDIAISDTMKEYISTL